MALAFTESTVDDLLRRTYLAIREEGQPVSPTRAASHELIGVSLELTQPRCRLSRTETRRRTRAGIAELAWYLSGTTDPEMIVHWVPRHKQEVEEDGTIRGAYGPRMFGTGDNAQFSTVLNLLATSSTSRRAVIQLFDASDLTGPGRYKDVPCTSTLQFFVRDARLHLMVTMRSNDAFIGFGCVNPIWDHDDGLTGTHLAPANHALGLGGHCRVARAIGICRPDRGYRFRALGGLHRRGAQPRCREVL